MRQMQMRRFRDAANVRAICRLNGRPERAHNLRFKDLFTLSPLTLTLVVTVRLLSGWTGLKLPPRGALGSLCSPCISFRRLDN